MIRLSAFDPSVVVIMLFIGCRIHGDFCYKGPCGERILMYNDNGEWKGLMV